MKHHNGSRTEEPEFSYRPAIDPLSEELMRRKKNDMLGRNIWEHLYNMDKVLKEKRDQSHLEKKLKEEEASLQGCTFQPRIKGLGSQSGDVSYKQEGDIYERTKMWKKSIEDKIRKKKDTYEKEEEKSCVFKPELSAKQPAEPSVTPIGEIKGVSKFMERQKVANEARKEKELYQRRDIGANWVRKVTIPAEFKLTVPASVRFR